MATESTNSLRIYHGYFADVFKMLQKLSTSVDINGSAPNARRRAMKRSILAVTMQIAVVPACRQTMLTALLDYVTGSQSISGLESLFLTLLYAEYRSDAPKSALFQRGTKVWEGFGETNTPKSIGALAVFDVHRDQLLLIASQNATEIVNQGLDLSCDFAKTLASKATFIGSNIFSSIPKGQPPSSDPDFVLVGDVALENDIGMGEFRAVGPDIWPLIEAAGQWIADKAVAFWDWLTSFVGDEQLAAEIGDVLGDMQVVDI